MAEQEKGPLEKLIDGLPGWKASFDQLRERIGWPGAALVGLLLACVLLWWKWKDIKELPGVEPLIERLKRRAIPTAPAGRLTIAVAHLERDKHRGHEDLLLDELLQFESVEAVSVDRTIEWPAAGSESEKRKKAGEKARGLLKKTSADVLIWGRVRRLNKQTAMQLYWTPAGDVPGAKSSGKYQPQTETLALPVVFWSDLKQILGLLTQSRIAALTVDQSGHYVADKLAPLIAQVRSLVQSREGVWNPETLAGVQLSLADALELDGEQSGKNEPLAESIALYRKVLEENTCARVPLQWATTQNNLGIALRVLGERESGTAQLDEAVEAYHDALQVKEPARACRSNGP